MWDIMFDKRFSSTMTLQYNKRRLSKPFSRQTTNDTELKIESGAKLLVSKTYECHSQLGQLRPQLSPRQVQLKRNKLPMP